MNSVSGFRPVYQYGRQIHPITSRDRFGPINGTFAAKLAPVLKYGGGVLGGFCIGFSITMLATNTLPNPYLRERRS